MSAPQPRRKSPTDSGPWATLAAELGVSWLDPMPTDQYLHFGGLGEPPLQRLVALVRSCTVANGRRRGFCVNEHGQELRLADLRRMLKMDRGNFHRAVKDACERGLIRIGDDKHPHRVYLGGKVPVSKVKAVGKGEDKGNSVVCTDYIPLSPADRKIIAGWPDEQQKRFYTETAPVAKRAKAIIADALAQARERADTIIAEARVRFGLAVRRLPKNKRERVGEFVQLTFLGEESVQTTSAQTTTPRSEQTAISQSVLAGPSLLSSKLTMDRPLASSSFSAEIELVAKRLELDDDVARDLLLETRRNEPSVTARVLFYLGAIKMRQLRQSKITNRAGLLLKAIPAMASGTTLAAARKYAAEEIERERRYAEDQLSLTAYSEDDPQAADDLTRIQSEARATLARLDQEQRQGAHEEAHNWTNKIAATAAGKKL